VELLDPESPVDALVVWLVEDEVVDPLVDDSSLDDPSLEDPLLDDPLLEFESQSEWSELSPQSCLLVETVSLPNKKIRCSPAVLVEPLESPELSLVEPPLLEESLRLQLPSFVVLVPVLPAFAAAWLKAASTWRSQLPLKCSIAARPCAESSTRPSKVSAITAGGLCHRRRADRGGLGRTRRSQLRQNCLTMIEPVSAQCHRGS
jgi:hypothetical protein